MTKIARIAESRSLRRGAASYGVFWTKLGTPAKGPEPGPKHPVRTSRWPHMAPGLSLSSGTVGIVGVEDFVDRRQRAQLREWPCLQLEGLAGWLLSSSWLLNWAVSYCSEEKREEGICTPTMTDISPNIASSSVAALHFLRIGELAGRMGHPGLKGRFGH